MGIDTLRTLFPIPVEILNSGEWMVTQKGSRDFLIEEISTGHTIRHYVHWEGLTLYFMVDINGYTYHKEEFSTEREMAFLENQFSALWKIACSKRESAIKKAFDWFIEKTMGQEPYYQPEMSGVAGHREKARDYDE